MVPHLSILSALSVIAIGTSTVSAIWPLPRNPAGNATQTINANGSSALLLSPDFSIDISIPNAPSDLADAVSRTSSYLKKDKLGRLVVGRGASDSDRIKTGKTLSSLTISLLSTAASPAKSISEEAIAPLESRQEGYTLTVPVDGSAATLSANTTLGIFRGLTTFSQLWYEYQDTVYTTFAPLDIQDAPAYPYRGLMLDTSRNYFPVADIKRTIDAASWVKISTFHWHIVDSQSFPLVVPGFPALAGNGAYSEQSVYTAEDVKDVVEYAAARGIDVLGEIDTPGHTSAISKSYPEHIACAESTPWATYANEPPAGQLRIGSTATLNFTSALVKAAAGLFSSQYFSTGGDEINARCYTDDAQTQSDLASKNLTFEQALDEFTQGTHAALKSINKTPVVWEEMVIDHPVTLQNDTLVMVWISSQNVQAVAEKGHKVVHAASDYFYLDCGAGGWVGAAAQGNSWCDPFKTWQKAYSFDPVANLTDAQSELIMGGQSLLWTEQSNPANLDSIVWPRAAAAAEVFWSGGGGDGRAALPRLHEIAFRMQQRGVGAIALQPLWCALRPGACDIDA